MKKDVIYIDTEDDITAIIGKIKESREKIVAIVPPKRIGVLQSAVNLRLLARMAENGGKRLVIITNNKALTVLASMSQIHIAKNLQSKPEVAEIPALEIDDGEDIIDGIKLPVEDLVKASGEKTEVKFKKNEEKEIDETIETINVEDETVTEPKDNPKSESKNKVKVPNFTQFRKKFFLGAVAFVIFVIFLIWANTVAPSAKIIITAKTEKTPVSMSLNLVGSSATDTTKSTVQSITKEIKKSVSIDFVATGSKEVGEKATGTLTLSNSHGDPINVPVGSTFKKGDFNFLTVASVDVPGAGVDHGEVVSGQINIGIVAEEVGSKYNLSEGSYISYIDDISAYGSATNGGESHTATVVTQEDIDKANQALQALSTKTYKDQLTKQFSNGEFVVSDSFTVDRLASVSTPELDKEVITGSKAKLSSETTFKLTAIAKSEIETYLKLAINKQIDNSKLQRIYDNGSDTVKFSGYFVSDQTAIVNLTATGKIGPNIDETSIKKQAVDKRYGDVQSTLERIEGVSDVDIKFSYFWVTKVPKDLNKIDIEFTVKND